MNFISVLERKKIGCERLALGQMFFFFASFYSLVVFVDGLLCTLAKGAGLTDCCTILFALCTVKFLFHNVCMRKRSIWNTRFIPGLQVKLQMWWLFVMLYLGESSLPCFEQKKGVDVLLKSLTT